MEGRKQAHALWSSGKYEEYLTFINQKINSSENNKWWYWTKLVLLNKIDEARKFGIENEEYFKNDPELNGLYNHRMGSLSTNYNSSKAIEFIQKAIEIFKSIKDYTRLSLVLLHLGYIYMFRGELDLAIYYSEKSKTLMEKYNFESELALISINLGKINAQKGDLTLSRESFDRGLEIAKRKNQHLFVAKGYYYMITELDKGLDQSKAEFYMNELKEIKETSDAPIISVLHEFVRGIYLKLSNRVKDKAEAEQIFNKIHAENVHDYDINLQSLYNLLELLLVEFKTYKEEDVLNEISSYITKMQEIATDNKLLTWIVKSSILKARLFVIHGKFSESEELLEEALNFTENNSLTKLAEKIIAEKKNLESQFDEMKKMINENRSFEDRLQKIEMLDYIQQARKFVE